MKMPQSAADVLKNRVELELECSDRMDLNPGHFATLRMIGAWFWSEEALDPDRIEIVLSGAVDPAFRTESDGCRRGVVEGLEGELPKTLEAITTDWQRLSVPAPFQ